MRLLPCLILLAACTAQPHDEVPVDRDLSAAEFSPDTEWLASARAAAARSAWKETAFFLDQWQAAHPEAPPEEYWELRRAQALGAGNPAAAEAARVAWLLLLNVPRADPEDQMRAWCQASTLEEAAHHFTEAALLLEQAAALPEAGPRAPAWWERASWLWERAGNRAAATRAIERALAGVTLSERDQAALDRLRAFELGELATPSDAQAVLRFAADPEARLQAAHFLADAVFEDDVAIFARALSDPDPRVLRLSLQQLGERVSAGEEAYVSSLAVPFLNHADQDLRLAALGLLAESGSRAQVPALLDALQPEERAQFRAARRALEAVTDHVEIAPLDPDLDGRRRLRDAWLAWWKSQGGG
jgi:hypothetical protein